MGGANSAEEQSAGKAAAPASRGVAAAPTSPVHSHMVGKVDWSSGMLYLPDASFASIHSKFPAPVRAGGASPKKKKGKDRADSSPKAKGDGKGKDGKKGKGDKGGKGKGEKGTKGFEPYSGPQASGTGYRLNVKHLTEETTSEQLKEMFQAHGSVSMAQVKTYDDGKSRGFGFVVMSTEEEGKAAIATMNGKEVNGKVLSVGPAERRSSVEGFVMEDPGAKGKGKKGGKVDQSMMQQQAMAAAYMQQYQQYFYLQQLQYYQQYQQHGSNQLNSKSYEGSLKSISVKNGYGFIVCAETHSLYQRDVYVGKEILPDGAKVADRLQFTVQMNEKGHPKATTCSFAVA